MNLDKLFNPKSVAIVGATDKPGAFGKNCAENALKSANADRIYLINPKRDELFGRKCYKSLNELPEIVDCVAICTPANTVNALIAQAGELGIKGIVVYASGFSEDHTPQGEAMEKEMADLAKEYGLKIVGPNGLGYINNVDKICLWGLNARIDMNTRPTGIGVVAQSGFIAANIVQKEYFNISYAISTGNGNAFTLDEALEFLVESPSVKVVAAYLEGIKDAKVFSNALKKAAQIKKPVIILKAGTSSKGAVSAASHTGNLAGSSKSYEAVFEKFGVVQVESLEELMNTAQMYSVLDGKLPKNTGFAGINLSGGENTICADLSEKYGVDLPDLNPDTIIELKKYIPPFATAKNPLDATTALFSQEDNIYHSIRVMGDDPSISSVIFGMNIAGDKDINDTEKNISRAMMRYLKDFPDKSNLFVIPSYEERRNMEWRRKLEASKIPVMSSADVAYRVLSKLSKFINYKYEEKTLEIAAPEISKKGKNKIALTEFDSKAEMLKYGISVTKQSIANNEQELTEQLKSMKYPVVLKINSPDILHKTEAGGVALNIANKEEAVKAFNEILKNCKAYKPYARIEGILVQEMAEKGLEIIIGVTNDPQFGPMILVGLGGVFVEVFKDVSLYPCPINKNEALNMIRKLKAYKLLTGYRGSKPCDVDALADMMVGISNYAMQNKDTVAEMDLNPVFVYPKGKGVMAVDALIVKYE